MRAHADPDLLSFRRSRACIRNTLFRLAGLSLGNSVWSASLVLAAFMAGLALGNGLVARLHQRVLKPIRAVCRAGDCHRRRWHRGTADPARLTNVFGPLFGSLTEAPALLNTIRLTISFITF